MLENHKKQQITYIDNTGLETTAVIIRYIINPITTVITFELANESTITDSMINYFLYYISGSITIEPKGGQLVYIDSYKIEDID